MKRSDLKIGEHVAYRGDRYSSGSEVIVLSTDAWERNPHYWSRRDDLSQILPVIVDGEAKAFDVSQFHRREKKRTALVAYVGSDRVDVVQLSHLAGPWEQYQEDRRRQNEEQQARNLKEQQERERLMTLADVLSKRLGVRIFAGTYGWNTVVIGTDELAEALDRLTDKV